MSIWKRSRIKTVCFALACLLGMSACASAPQKEDSEPYSMLCPNGAPALATLGAANVENTVISRVEGTDALLSELAKKDGEYDVIVAPINLGAKVYSQAEAYQLAAVVTWGNLYVVGSQDKAWEDPNNKMALFGENAVPGLVYNDVLADQVKAQTTWYNAVSDAQQALLSNQADLALLAQPAAAATISKAKENGKELKVIANLQEMWKEKRGNDTTGYPQAGIFIKKDGKKNLDALLTGIETFDENVNEKSIVEAVEAAGAENLGLPNAQIAAKTWDAQNIRYVTGPNAKEQIEQFLSLFSIALPETLIAE
ncbi:hypothetical protein [Dubosiella newyorkensis]|uniref:hypothetical protein n=1 Tax=Dubosiella newyorkensis TaxID=1862672 RepID=UPI0032B23998